jgi:hypothetical protein
MRPIFIAMLCVQVALVLVVAFTVLTARTPAGSGRPRPYWSSLAIALVIASGASFQIADRHSADPVSHLVEYGSALLMGMGLMSLLLLLRQRLGRDAPA